MPSPGNKASLLVVLVLALAGAAPGWSQAATARSNLALMTGEQYTRPHEYDLIHQRITISRFNWDSASFDGVVTTTLVSRRAGLDAVVLDEGRRLVNTRVFDRNGRALATSRSNDTLIVRPARPLRAGDTLVFTITYHGSVKSGDGLTFITNDGLPHRPNQIWSMGETNSNHYWFPTYDAPDDKLTWELIATVPREDLAISNGRLVSNTVSGNLRTMSWHQDTPSASYLVSLVVAPLAKVHDSWQGIPVDYYTYHEDSTRAWPLFHVTTDMIDTYSRLTGVRYPWPKYAQTTVADFFGGMENVSATTLVDWLPDARAYRDRPWYQHILIPHELAHQWFGDYVTTKNWAHTWLNEGFAEFMPGQYWGEKLGAHAEQDYYLDEYRQYLDIEARRSMPLASMGSNNLYPKGALVVKMLKDYLGPERFWASINKYLVTNALGSATSDDVGRAVLAATGEDVAWFWNQWIYAAGMPQFNLKASYDPAGARLTIVVRQVQVDSFTQDSAGRLFSVPQVFRAPVTIRVGLPGGDRLYRTEINAREQVIVVDSIAAAPTMVVFDDGNRILKTLDFDQPVRWLAEQLRRDENLWNRQWAIGSLAGHRDDPAAAAALAAAATSADYFTTRVGAAEALADFPQAAALTALQQAARDTSAAVRAAAVASMKRFGGAVVETLAFQLFQGDSSDAVRAAALTTLLETGSNRSHDAIGQALGMPSYQDAIRNAAFYGIVLTNDTTYVDRVDAAIDQQEYPSHVLAALGGRGSPRALALLTGHLNDRRAGVRRWALAAFGNTMARVDRAVALGQLKSALDGITDPATHKQVADLIATLDKP